jgi:hypothetical protein
VGAGGQVVAEVAEGVLDGAEELALGQVDECVGHAFEDGVGVAAEGLEDELAALFTIL